MNKKNILGNIMLLITSVIWGAAFAAQRLGMNYMGPFTFMAARYFLAFLSLGILSFVVRLYRSKYAEKIDNKISGCFKDYLISGIVTGCFLFLGSSFQQVGILYTSVGKAGFITSLYIIIIPIFEIFTGGKISKLTFMGIIFAVIGLYLLTVKESFSIEFGDFIVLISSFIWAGHILSIGYFTNKVNPVYMSFFQFAVCFLLSLSAMFVFEYDNFKNIFKAFMQGLFPIIYAGVFSAGVGYTFQMIAQRYTNPTIASLILSMEAVFGTISGYYFLNEILTVKELLGCAILFAAIIIAQLPDIKSCKNN